MKLMGLDLGFASLGMVIWEGGRFVQAKIWRSEKIPKKLSCEANLERARNLAEWLRLEGILTMNAVICEAMSFTRHASIAHKMGIAWGVLAACLGDVACFQLSPQEIRRLLGLPKGASKKEVQTVICKMHPELIDLAPKQKTLREHHYDAAACVLAWLRTEQGRFLCRVD